MSLRFVKLAAFTSLLPFFGTFLGSLNVVRADNPFVQTIYTADPAPLVWNDRLYVFTSHDEDGATYFDMRDWRVFSTTDMANWQDHGSPLSLATFPWANRDAWAGQAIARNGKFYWYVPIRKSNGVASIGVAVANNILGPYTDPLGRPLVENNEIDPSVFIDTDGQAYLYWGNPNLSYVKLNSDMISYSGGIVKVNLTTQGFGTRPGATAQRPTAFEEGPWLSKRDNLYHMTFAANCCSENIQYSTGPTATGPWTYRGMVMTTQGSSFTNHPAVVDYKGNSYFFYHNGALPGGGGYQRSVAVERFTYGSNGTIPSMTMTTAGPPQIGTLNPFVRNEAETMAFSSGLKTEVASGGGMAVSFINNNDYIKVKGVAFGNGAKSFSARVSSGTSGGQIQLRLGNQNGNTVGTCTVPGTGGWSTWTTVTCNVSGATGTQDLFFRFAGGSDYLFNFDWWQFTA